MSFDLELIDNDLKIKADGSIRTVTDTPKLRQDIIKILMTQLGSVRAHPWYGCSVSEEVVGKTLPNNILSNQIQASVSQSLERLKSLQTRQSATQEVSLAEIIEAIADTHAERDLNDQRKLNIFVTVLSKRLTKVEEVFVLLS